MQKSSISSCSGAAIVITSPNADLSTSLRTAAGDEPTSPRQAPLSLALSSLHTIETLDSRPIRELRQDIIARELHRTVDAQRAEIRSVTERLRGNALELLEAANGLLSDLSPLVKAAANLHVCNDALEFLASCERVFGKEFKKALASGSLTGSMWDLNPGRSSLTGPDSRGLREPLRQAQENIAELLTDTLLAASRCALTLNSLRNLTGRDLDAEETTLSRAQVTINALTSRSLDLTQLGLPTRSPARELFDSLDPGWKPALLQTLGTGAFHKFQRDSVAHDERVWKALGSALTVELRKLLAVVEPLLRLSDECAAGVETVINSGSTERLRSVARRLNTELHRAVTRAERLAGRRGPAESAAALLAGYNQMQLLAGSLLETDPARAQALTAAEQLWTRLTRRTEGAIKRALNRFSEQQGAAALNPSEALLPETADRVTRELLRAADRGNSPHSAEETSALAKTPDEEAATLLRTFGLDAEAAEGLASEISRDDIELTLLGIGEIVGEKEARTLLGAAPELARLSVDAAAFDGYLKMLARIQRHSLPEPMDLTLVHTPEAALAYCAALERRHRRSCAEKAAASLGLPESDLVLLRYGFYDERTGRYARPPYERSLRAIALAAQRGGVQLNAASAGSRLATLVTEGLVRKGAGGFFLAPQPPRQDPALQPSRDKILTWLYDAPPPQRGMRRD